MELEEIASIVVDCGYQIHRRIGPGLLERVYQTIMSRDLSRRGLSVEARKFISFDYEGLWFADAFVADIVVEGKVVIELKAVKELLPVHYLQLRTYMRLMGTPLGFLMNFNEALFKNGVRRLAIPPAVPNISEEKIRIKE